MDSNENSSRRISTIEFLENKANFFVRNHVLSLFIIGSIALLLRLFYFPSTIPITLDGLFYFWYAIDISILGHFPTGYAINNNGWPTFLSIFFSIFHSNKFMDYMTIQRLLTLSISVLTIIPIYFLCRRFFDKSYALVGSALFVFEPRIIQNSLLGLTEPLYIFLITFSTYFFLGSNKKQIYIGFAIAALASLVRSEGLFILFALSIMFFIRFRKERRVIAKYAIAIAIIVLILLPMAIIRIQTTGSDGLTSRISSRTADVLTSSTGGSEKISLISYLINGLENTVKFFGWSLIPIFIFFIPLGFLLILKNRNHNNTTIIVIMILMSIPAFYGLSQASDTRYLFPFYPLFCILSIYAIKRYNIKFKNHNTFLILLVSGILLSSMLFLDFKKMDTKHEEEALSLAYQVANRTSVINSYYPESGYLIITAMTQISNFPILHAEFKGESIRQINIHAKNMEEYIKSGKDAGLTHLVLDGTDNFQNRPTFFKDVFLHEEKYPYLIKTYDSWDHGYKYHLKIFKIDYNEFQSIINKNNVS